jgi:predicted component of type VI protein secretion system
MIFTATHGDTLDSLDSPFFADSIATASRPVAAVPSAFAMEVRFIFKTASGKRQVLARSLPLVIGRSSKAGLRIPSEKEAVSRRHCEVVLDDRGRVCIRDLGSTNGTFLDGRELRPDELAPAKSGAGVKLGDVGFRIEYAAVAAAASSAAEAPNEHEGRDEGQDELVPEEAAGPGLPATEPLVADTSPELQPDPIAADEQPLSLAELEADEPAAAGGFGFLADAEPAADADGGWPTDAADAPAAGDDKLDDFFKGLS